MEPTDPHPPMLAKEAESTGQGSSAKRSDPRRRSEPGLPPGADADAVVEQILARLEKGLYLPARDLTKEAAARFPEHARLQRLWWFFDKRGKSRIAPGGPEPSRREEFEWLRHPPDWARGKWVALIGGEAVAVGDTLKEVAASVRAQELSRRPLVHRID